MNGQGDRLRHLTTIERRPPRSRVPGSRALIAAVTSGKGGVGKSVLAANLAVERRPARTEPVEGQPCDEDQQARSDTQDKAANPAPLNSHHGSGRVCCDDHEHRNQQLDAGGPANGQEPDEGYGGEIPSAWDERRDLDRGQNRHQREENHPRCGCA